MVVRSITYNVVDLKERLDPTRSEGKAGTSQAETGLAGPKQQQIILGEREG